MTNRTRLVAIAASLAAASSSLSGTVGPNQVDPPTTVSLTGVVRDFRERTVAGAETCVVTSGALTDGSGLVLARG